MDMQFLAGKAADLLKVVVEWGGDDCNTKRDKKRMDPEDGDLYHDPG